MDSEEKGWEMVEPRCEGWLRRAVKVAVAAVLVVGGVILGNAVRRNLPWVMNTDEVFLVSRALALPMMRFHPQWFGYPSLSFYLLAGAYGVCLGGAYVFGLVRSVTDCVRLYLEHPWAFYVVARGLAAGCVLLSAVLMYRVGLEVFSRRAAVAGALVMVLLPVVVENGATVRVENYQMPLLAGAMLMALRAADGGRWKHYLWAGVLTGLATSVKYPGALMLASVWAAHIVVVRRERCAWWRYVLDARLMGACALSVVAFFAGSPFAAIDLPTFLSDLRMLKGVAHVYWASYGAPGGVSVLGALGEAFTIPMAVLGLGALVWCVLRRRGAGLVLGVYPLLCGAYLGKAAGVRAYWFVALAPFVACALAGLLVDGLPRVLVRADVRGMRWVELVPIVVVVGWLGVLAAKRSWEMAGLDTRVEARQWMLENAVSGAGVLMEHGRYLPKGSVPLPECAESIERRVLARALKDGPARGISDMTRKYFEIQKSLAGERCFEIHPVVYDPMMGEGLLSALEFPDSLEEYRQQGVRYAIIIVETLEAYEWEFEHGVRREHARPFVELFRAIRREGVLRATFEAKGWVNDGPRVEIYELPESR